MYGSTPLGPLVPEPVEIAKELREKPAALRPPDPAVRFEGRLCEGEPAEEIIRLAGKTRSDLIVMGTHGRTGLGRLLLGSVAEEVLRRAPCPVLLLKKPFPDGAPSAAPSDAEQADSGVVPCS
jgi:nucleotide-binding universal stress UspA family protein